jgi:hypothetical protein
MAVANTSVLGGRRQGMLGRTGNSPAGMLGSTPAPYATPAPKGAAGEQAQANVWAANETANINRVNQTNPFGTQTFTRPTEPGGQWSSTTTLNPGEQANLDRQRGLTGSILDMGQKRVGMLGNGGPLEFGAPAPVAADYNGPNSATTNALYGAYTSRLDSQWQREQESLRTRLANQGINVGSEAYANEQDIFGKSKNDAYTQALANAVGMGVTENSNAFNRALSSRKQGVDEAVLQRNQPLNELQVLLGLAPGVNTPTFNNAPAVNISSPDTQAEDRLKAQQEAAAQANEQAKRSANLGAAAGLAGSALSAFGPTAAKALIGGGTAAAGGGANLGMLAGEAAGAGGSSLVLPAFGGTAAGGANLGMLAGEAGAAPAAAGAGEVALNGGGGTYALSGGAGADMLGASGTPFLASSTGATGLAAAGSLAAAMAFPFIAGPTLNKLVGGGVNRPSQEQVETQHNNMFGPALENIAAGRDPLYGYTTRYVPLDEMGSGDTYILVSPTGASAPRDSFLDALRNSGINPTAQAAPQNLERMPRMVR